VQSASAVNATQPLQPLLMSGVLLLVSCSWFGQPSSSHAKRVLLLRPLPPQVLRLLVFREFWAGPLGVSTPDVEETIKRHMTGTGQVRCQWRLVLLLLLLLLLFLLACPQPVHLRPAPLAIAPLDPACLVFQATWSSQPSLDLTRSPPAHLPLPPPPLSLPSSNAQSCRAPRAHPCTAPGLCSPPAPWPSRTWTLSLVGVWASGCRPWEGGMKWPRAAGSGRVR